MTPFEKAFAAARASRKSSFEFPPGSGRTYSTETMEDRQRKAYSDTSRGRDVPARKAEIPGAGPYKAPPATGGGMSETRRNVANIVSAVPAARAVGAVGKAMQATSAARAAPAAKRVEPLLYTSRGEKGKFVPSSAPKGGAKAPERPEPPMYKKGGLVKKGR